MLKGYAKACITAFHDTLIKNSLTPTFQGGKTPDLSTGTFTHANFQPLRGKD